MAIMIDSSNLEIIQKYHSMGLLRGVTTNPTILLKEGVIGGIDAVLEHSLQIANLIKPYPVSVELTTNDPKEMIIEANTISKLAKNMIVKVTIHGPEGETENLRVVNELERNGISVNVTAMMSTQQCLLAAMAGASYVSLFCGRVNNMGYNATEEIRHLRKLLDNFNLKAQIIAASTREVFNVVDWLEAGAHYVTVLPDFLEKMIVHPYSKETIQMFLNDAKRAKGRL